MLINILYPPPCLLSIFTLAFLASRVYFNFLLLYNIYMSGKEELQVSEQLASKGLPVSHSNSVVGKGKKKGKGKTFGKYGKYFASGFIGLFLILIIGSIGSIYTVILGFNSRLTEASNIQHADAVQSKQEVIKESLIEGNIPNNTANLLKENGAEIGYVENDEFIEDNNSGKESVIRYNGKIVTADNFKSVVNSDPGLYDAINKATYSDAAYYYDDAANRVYKNLGISRNNYTDNNKSFEEVMTEAVGEGSNISIGSASTAKDEKGNETSELEGDGEASTSGASIDTFVNEVRSKNKASTALEATMNTAGSLNAADTISKQQRSSRFFMAFMENISKVMAGEGDKAKIHEMMNFANEEKTSRYVDVDTDTEGIVKGAMVESPSLYAVLSGSRVDIEKAKNYSSDRILATVNNKNGGGVTSDTVKGTVTSSDSGVRGSIGRYITGNEEASDESLGNIAIIIQDSLIDNSFETIGGIAAGEMLVDGAMNIGRALAKASGATPGDEESVKEYARLTASVLAMEAKVDRMNRSPFDITSKNTFLGSIIWNMAINFHGNSMLKQIGSILRTTGTAISKISLSTYADDSANMYYAVAGANCYTACSIGAMAWANGLPAVTFDTTTTNAFSDSGFEAFVNENTTINASGNREIIDGSSLGKFIKNNVDKLTIDGVTDAGVLESKDSNSLKIPFISDIVSMVKNFVGASEEEKREASGEAYVKSSSNRDWDTYKYAQRYVSLARAQDALRQYDGDVAAFSNLKFFEGTENPVIAYLESLDLKIAKK